MHSWQAHLQSISQLHGNGVWWKADSNSYEFLDGSEEEDFNSNGPIQQHFRNTPLPEVYKEKVDSWTKTVNENVELPTSYIKLYNNLGNFAGLRYFGTVFYRQMGTTRRILQANYMNLNSQKVRWK